MNGGQKNPPKEFDIRQSWQGKSGQGYDTIWRIVRTPRGNSVFHLTTNPGLAIADVKQLQDCRKTVARFIRLADKHGIPVRSTSLSALAKEIPAVT